MCTLHDILLRCNTQYNTLQNTLQHKISCSTNTLQCTHYNTHCNTHCNTHESPCACTVQRLTILLRTHTATHAHCNTHTLQHTHTATTMIPHLYVCVHRSLSHFLSLTHQPDPSFATHAPTTTQCNTLPKSATHCNTLQKCCNTCGAGVGKRGRTK